MADYDTEDLQVDDLAADEDEEGDPKGMLRTGQAYDDSSSSSTTTTTSSSLVTLQGRILRQLAQQLHHRKPSSSFLALAEPHLVATHQVLARRHRVDGHKLIDVSRKEVEPILARFLQSSHELDLWNSYEDRVILRVAPSLYARFFASLPDVVLLMDNVQMLIDAETLRIAASSRPRPSLQPPASLADFFSEFRTYEETRDWYKALASTHPELATFVPSIGSSVEGRDIFALKLGADPLAAPPKPAIFMHALQHAREWISGSTLNYLVWHVLCAEKNARNSASANAHAQSHAGPMTSLLMRVELIIVPIMNPDGYAFTWSSNRLWRKNRAKNVVGRGVDLNRNWGEHWGGPGTSGNPLSDIYRGPHAESEPEVRAMQAFFLAEACANSSSPLSTAAPSSCAARILGCIDFHAYSQLVMWPYGYTETPYRFEPQHADVARHMVADIAAASDDDLSVAVQPTPLSVFDASLLFESILSPSSVDIASTINKKNNNDKDPRGRRALEVNNGGKGAPYRAIPIRELYLASGSSVDWYSSPANVRRFGGRVPYTITIELRPAPNDPRGFLLPPSEILPTAKEILPAFFTFIDHCLHEPLHV